MVETELWEGRVWAELWEGKVRTAPSSGLKGGETCMGSSSGLEEEFCMTIGRWGCW